MKALLLGASASIAIAIGATPALAQTDRDVVYVWGQLEETLAQEIEKTGSRLDVVTAEDIKNGGYVDVGQALQMQVPGLYVAPKNGPFDYVNASLLGGRRVDVIWLVDGVRISNRLYTTTTPLDTIPASMIDKIEVLKGGQSLFYGTSAVSGAINIVTKGFTKDQVGSFSAGFGSDEERHIDGYTSGSFGDHNFVLFASHDEAEGYQPFRDQDYQPSATDRNRGYDVTNFGAKYGYEFSPDTKLSVNYQHTDAVLDFANQYETYTSHNDRDEDILSAKLDWTFGDQFSFFAKAYYHWWDTRFTDIRNTEPPSGTLITVSDNDYWGFKDYGVNLLGQYKLNPDVTLLGGVDYQNYNGEDEVFLIDKKTEDVVAPFAQVRWDLDVLKGLTLAAGVRHNMPSGEGDTTVWNVSGNLQINDYFYARGQVGTSFRLPDAYELFVKDGCCEQGNPNLKGEKSFNIEAAIGGRAANATWEVTAFRRELEDLIQIITVTEDRTGAQPGNYACSDDPVNGCYDTFDNNGADVETTGIEAVATMDFGAGFSGTASWTHTEAEVDGANQQLQDIPLDVAKVLVDWAPDNLPVGAGLNATWVGELADNAPAGLGRRSIGDYVLVDANARWFLDSGRKHRLGFRIENLFDEEYFSAAGAGRVDVTNVAYYAPSLGRGRSFHVNYTFDF
ncbi:MAG: TonB-dependent receptor [Hyphomonadaceae bacterium]